MSIDKIRYPLCLLISGALRVKFPDIIPPPNCVIIVRADPGTCDILPTLFCEPVKMVDSYDDS